MKILLCAATEREIAPTIQALSKQESDGIDLLVTGVGLMATTYALTKRVSLHPPDLILQAGVGGTLDAAQPLATVVAIQSETVGDLGVQEDQGFCSLFDLKLLSPEMPPWTKGKLVNENHLLAECSLPLAAGVTVNEISTDPNRIGLYRQRGALVESMEGAALHYVALMEKIPFLQIRSLSNFIGERDKSKWMMQKAITNLNRELQRILKKLTA